MKRLPHTLFFGYGKFIHSSRVQRIEVTTIKVRVKAVSLQGDCHADVEC